MARVITNISQKGGVGKTTSSVQIAAQIAAMGYKTLLIDTDFSQANATRNIMGAIWDRETHTKGLGALVSQQASIDEVIYETDRPNLYMLPCEKKNEMRQQYNLESTLKDRGFDGYTFFKDTFDSSRIIQENIKFIIIDLGPQLATISVASLIASDYALIPVCTEFFSLDSIYDTMEAIAKVKKQANPHLELLGLFISKEDKRLKSTRIAIAELEEITQKLGVHLFDTKIPISNKFAFLAKEQKTIYDLDSSTRGHQDYIQLTEEMLNRVKEIEISESQNIEQQPRMEA